MAHRYDYWSCSKFADWLRGTLKPPSETSQGWAKWRRAAKKAHPWRYWLADKGLNKLQDIIYWPVDLYRDCRSYYLNRFVDKLHYLRTGLEPGEYADTDERLLLGMFETLVDFVEVESSGWEGPRRSRENGLKHLEWAASLRHGADDHSDPASEHFGKPTPQAVSAQETIDIYLWYKDVRPHRGDPYDHGLGRKLTSDDYATLYKAEEAQHQEDEDYLIRLVKLRRSLWT